MIRHFALFLLIGVCWTGGLIRAADLSLAGDWQFIRGGPALAAKPSTLPELNFTDTIQLPGTTETRRKGPASDAQATDGLSFPWAFVGPCWYARDIEIPDVWRNQHVTLRLERTKYTQVWLDGKPIGDNVLCCTPQEYELGTNLAAGKHRLTIAVDNKRIPPVGADAHQFSGATQGNWNGILGRIELHATPAVWIDSVQTYPSAADHYVRVKVQVKSATDSLGNGVVAFNVQGPGVSAFHQPETPITWRHGVGEAEQTIDLYPDAQLWDELHPNLQTVAVELHSPAGEDQRQVQFGLRDFATKGTQFTINGRPTFLRGRHDACVFPLTGHPPMDVEGWLAYFRTLKSYGLNHVRFHTWTPPEAAFTAADQLGFYLQPELPFWGPFDQKVRDTLEPEAQAILRQLGNHPSFVMFSLGNEHWAGADVLDPFVADLKARDGRRLYVRGSNAFAYRGRPGKNDDFYIGADVARAEGEPIHHIRGANMGVGKALGHVQAGPPNTLTDYAAALEGTTFPSVAHEMGQYAVYPDFAQLTKYTGVTRPDNLRRFQSQLAAAGMAEQNRAFADASGTLAALCYREEIEAALRTPGFGGFELLDLQDYPGQGSALVGVLDAFMDSKNVIAPERWRQFCSPVVLLGRIAKYVWTSDETFSAKIEVANYGPQAIPTSAVEWKLLDASGTAVRSGAADAAAADVGAVTPFGSISIPLQNLPTPGKFELVLSLRGVDIQNRYSLWLYPPRIESAGTAVQIVRAFDAAAQSALADGKRVLLVCDAERPLAHTVGGGFANDFWAFIFFHNRPGTVGLLCDPASPAFKDFPTDSHADWHWFDLLMHNQPLVLNDVLPRGVAPIVQNIDNDVRNHKIGTVFELRVGSGRLLVCTSDLIRLGSEHPEARQLLNSLTRYADGESFDPTTSVRVEAVKTLFETTLPTRDAVTTASSHDPGWQGYAPGQLIDANEDKGWLADKTKPGPAWCQIDFKTPVDFSAVEVLWDKAGYDYTLAESDDGKTWKTLREHCGADQTQPRQRLAMRGRQVRHLRLTVEKTPDGQAAAINELKFFPD